MYVSHLHLGMSDSVTLLYDSIPQMTRYGSLQLSYGTNVLWAFLVRKSVQKANKKGKDRVWELVSSVMLSACYTVHITHPIYSQSSIIARRSIEKFSKVDGVKWNFT